ncbi:hypothetical protein OXI21_09400 [Ignatzschineria sp. RMDPL8A]|uniref:hypothetical protein n=1 Tax=Ignatzschineria sp. RMDPL8A TaxID=2999236 RepID=UPI00244661C7|nr:hypothetical protein [Ignatzschineria sp. RMDPL8A]MDG9730629.1 hypothetical protein [Ignatzschineria sp. RMDPL8A]
MRNQRNLIVSFFLLLIIAVGVMAYKMVQPIEEKVVTSRQGVVTMMLDSSFNDIYSAKRSPEGTLLLEQSSKHGMTVLVSSAILPKADRTKTLADHQKEIEEELGSRGILRSIELREDHLHYVMQADADKISTCDLYLDDGKMVVLSVVSRENKDQSELINAIMSSARYNFSLIR